MRNWFKRLGFRPFFIRLLHWEYWTFHSIYLPIYPVWFFLSLRARSFFFFAAANPRIRNGGFLSESKKDIAPLIPSHLHPKTAFFSIPANPDLVLSELGRSGLQFPLIGKPDIGGRGRGVKALRDEGDLRDYVRNVYVDFHVQEFVHFKQEVGIFYYRYPNELQGRLSGIVRKEFLQVEGDGILSIRNLIRKDRRAILQEKTLEESFGTILDSVLAPGEIKVLIPYGNHARGAKFLDGSRLIDETLTHTLDQICQQIPEFYFGRLDIRFSDWDQLREGKQFCIIEVNGAGAEPTHIYDPRHSLFFAWKEIIRHWIILWKISRQNHRRGVPYLTLREGIRMFREDKKNSQRLAAMKF